MRYVAAVGSIADPLLSPLHDAAVRKRALQKNNEALKARIDELELYALNNIALVHENEELRTLLGERAHTATSTLARVSTTIGAYPYGTFSIVATKPLTLGRGVFGPGHVLLGTITKTDGVRADVTLLSAPQRVSEVRVITSEEVYELDVQGLGLGNFEGKVPRDTTISVGDVVVSVAHEGVVIGQVRAVEIAPTDAIATIRIHVPLRLSTLSYVEVQQ